MEETILKTEFVNKFGETMTLIMTKDFKKMFRHEDCNNDFEDIEELDKTAIAIPESMQKQFKKRLRKDGTVLSFKYILDEDERKVLNDFIYTARATEENLKRNKEDVTV